MKNGLVVYLSFLICFTTYAQKEADAELLLKAVADKALAYKTIQTDFEYVIENVQTKTEEKYVGSLLLKGDKFRMSANEMVTYSDGKTRWVYLEESNEVNISKRNNSDNLEAEERFFNNPISLFTIYKSGFKYLKFGTETIDGKIYQLIDLSPDDINKPYFKIRCSISDSNDLFMIRYFQKDGTRISFQFKNFKTNVKINDNDFVFQVNDYPGVEVIDLRE
ncbi:MAG: outer membrane lipoprotein carrier protein LolA [Salinivirgaceae bacterium]|jgi:outer membrane lipoprotein-sorting protein